MYTFFWGWHICQHLANDFNPQNQEILIKYLKECDTINHQQWRRGGGGSSPHTVIRYPGVSAYAIAALQKHCRYNSCLPRYLPRCFLLPCLLRLFLLYVFVWPLSKVSFAILPSSSPVKFPFTLPNKLYLLRAFLWVQCVVIVCVLNNETICLVARWAVKT